MSSVSSPLGTFFQQAFSPPAADQNSPVQRLQPAEQQTPAPVDTVTLSGYFSGLSQANSPAPAAQPAAAVLGATLGGSSNTLASVAAPASGAATVVAAQNPAASSAPATGTGTGALPAAVQAAASPINATPAAQQQQLAQLDQILQQLGVDPNSIPVSEQLSMVLYLDDPVALAQLVQSLGQVVQTAHLKSLGGNGATPAQNPDQLKSAPTETGLAAAAAAGANQNAAAAAANQISTAAAQPQIAALATAPAAAQAAAPAGNAAGAANAPNPAAPAVNGFAAQFQELQFSLQALGANTAFAGGGGAAAAPGGALNVVA